MYRQLRKIQNRVNEEITSSKIRIVNDDEISSDDILNKHDALKISDNRETDLIEISFDSANNISICKLMDIGKFAYEQKKKQKDIKKPEKIKEIRLTPVIGKNDLEIKKSKIHDFILAGNPVKIGLFFKGRELYLMKDEGEKMILSIADCFSDIARLSNMPKIEGKRMTATLFPKK